jgi:hypothetical protein
MKFWRDILTGIDGQTYDNGRVLCFMSYMVYFGLAIAALAIGKPWQPMDFASGVGTMAVGFGVNLHLKKSTEPGHENN